MATASSSPPSVYSADGRPYPPESRRLKACGLALVVLAAPGGVWLSNHPLAEHWLSGSARDLATIALVFLVSINLAAAGVLALTVGLGAVRSWRESRGRRAAVLAFVAANVAIPVIAFSFLQEDPAVDAIGDLWYALAAITVIALYITMLKLLRRSQRWEAPSAEELRRRDPRPPVVYLRAFADDGQAALDGLRRHERAIAQAVTALTLTSAEQELAFILQRVGPVIAIGRPGEPLPELGASRLYVEHESWQQTVLEMIDGAAMVLVRVGGSPGVLWELDQVMSRVARPKVLVLMLGSGDVLTAGVQELERRLGETLQVAPLPVYRWRRLLAMLASDPHKSIGVLIGFDAAARAHAESIPAITYGPSDLARTLMMRPLAGPLRAAGRKLFARLGRVWHEPPNRIFAVVLAVLAGGFGGHWFYLGSRRKGIRRLLLLPVIWLTAPYAWYEAIRWVLADRRQFEESVAADVARG